MHSKATRNEARERIVDREVRKLERRQAIERKAARALKERNR